MKRNSIWIAALALLLSGTLFSSCEKEDYGTIDCEMEQPTTDSDGKTYLGHAEEWIYWEKDDAIACKFYGVNDKLYSLTLKSGAKTVNASFEGDFNKDFSDYILAVYPSSACLVLEEDEVDMTTGKYDNDVNGEKKLTFPATQPYRSYEADPDNSAVPLHTDSDSSFGKGCLPMVGYGTKTGGLYFHVVAGLVRVQLFSTLTEVKNIESVEFSSVPNNDGKYQQLSGTFDIQGITTYTPYLASTVSTTSLTNDNKITISNIDDATWRDGGKASVGVGTSPFLNTHNLVTFYLALPAVGGGNAYTEYNLQMKVRNTEGGVYVKKFKVDVHRRNITFMPAINISKWESDSDNPTTTGSTDVSIVGNGSKDRPFEIYSAAELAKLRDAVNNNTTINGQTINSNTHIKISRTDIVLNSTNWTTGFTNFKSHLYFSSSTAVQGGITNQSGSPIFNSINSEGVVERLNVKGNYAYQGASGTDFSSFCRENNGKIIDCHNQCNITSSNGANLAGLCVTNNGTIRGGANEANLTSGAAGGNVAGICLYNNGTIQGNFTLSSALPKGGNIAGICYMNNEVGKVKDCQISANAYSLTATGNWGGIVFNNQGTIDNCVSSGTVIFSTTGSIAGICNLNSGTVKNCSNRVTQLEGKAGSSGGIVGKMTGGVVYNCYSAASATVKGYQRGANVNAEYGGNAGGIVGMLADGYILNSYNRSAVTTATNSGGVVGVVFGGKIANCYNGNGKNFCGAVGEGSTVITNILTTNCFSRTTEEGCVSFNETQVNGVAASLSTILNTWRTNGDRTPALPSPLTADSLKAWSGDNYYPVLVNQTPSAFRDATGSAKTHSTMLNPRTRTRRR